jgi:hypothetical protein
LREPADSAVLGCVKIGFCDQLVEGRGLICRVFFVEVPRQSQMGEVVFLLYSFADASESGTG